MKKQTEGHQPKRPKLALLTFLGLLIPVYTIPPALQSLLPDHHLLSVIALGGFDGGVHVVSDHATREYLRR